MSKCFIDDEEVMQHALELILDLEHMYDDGKIDEGTFAYLLSEVNKFNFFTPADVKPVVKGEWITDYCAVNGHSDIYCSVCNKDATYFVGSSDEIHWSEEYPAYCPNCGAEMREEKNDEDTTVFV